MPAGGKHIFAAQRSPGIAVKGDNARKRLSWSPVVSRRSSRPDGRDFTPNAVQSITREFCICGQSGVAPGHACKRDAPTAGWFPWSGDHGQAHRKTAPSFSGSVSRSGRIPEAARKLKAFCFFPVKDTRSIIPSSSLLKIFTIMDEDDVRPFALTGAETTDQR